MTRMQADENLFQKFCSKKLFRTSSLLVMDVGDKFEVLVTYPIILVAKIPYLLTLALDTKKPRIEILSPT